MKTPKKSEPVEKLAIKVTRECYDMIHEQAIAYKRTMKGQMEWLAEQERDRLSLRL